MELKRQPFIIMKKLSFILTIMIGLGLSSCSVGRYVNPSQNLNFNQTQIVLSEANFRVVKHVSISTIYTQSSMRFDSDQLYQSAYAELLKKAKLTGSQALINVTVELVERTIGIWFFRTDCSIIASGVVIEFINPNTPQDEFVTGGAIDGGSLNGGTIQDASSTNTITAGALVDDEERDELNETLIKDVLHKYKTATLEIEGEMLSERKIEEYRTYFTKIFNQNRRIPLQLTVEPADLTIKLQIINKKDNILSTRIYFIEKQTGHKTFVRLGRNDIKSLAKKFTDKVNDYYSKL